MSQGPAQESRREKSRIGSLVVPALALLPGAAFMGFYFAHMARFRMGMSTMIGGLVFVAFFLPVARLAVRTLRSHTWDEEMSPAKVLIRSLPLYAVMLAFPVWSLVSHLRVAALRSLDGVWSLVPLLLAVGAFTLACAWPIFTAARALQTQALDAIDDSLVASATSLFAMGILARFASEADRIESARSIGVGLHALALVCAGSALFVAWRRWRWAATAYRAGGTTWAIVAYQANVHGPLVPLDVSKDASASDGVIVHFAGNPHAPYRASDGAVVAVARAWRDEARALRPLVRRRILAAGLAALVVGATPFLVAAARAHQDPRYTTSGPLGFPPKCTRRDPIYFVPIGQQEGFDIDALAKRYSETYGRPFFVAPHRRMPPIAFSARRSQWNGEKVLDDLFDDAEEIAPKGSIIIALTSDDLYLGSANWGFAFGTRLPPNMAIVSTARMRAEIEDGADVEAIADTRLRKMITRDLGYLYCKLGTTYRSNSVLFFRNMGQPDLDGMDESVW